MQQSADKVRVELSREELKATVQFLQDHIFRVKHIDPKIPENRSNMDLVRDAETALAALQQASRNPSLTITPAAPPPKKIDQTSFHRPVRAARGRQG